MIGSHFDVVILLDVSALEPQLAGLSVEVDVLHGDGQSCPDTVAVREILWIIKG